MHCFHQGGVAGVPQRVLGVEGTAYAQVGGHHFEQTRAVPHGSSPPALLHHRVAVPGDVHHVDAGQAGAPQQPEDVGENLGHVDLLEILPHTLLDMAAVLDLLVCFCRVKKNVDLWNRIVGFV